MKLKNILFALGALMLTQLARADDKALQILQETVTRTAATQTLQAAYRITGQAGGYKHTRATGTMRLKRPNLAAIEVVAGDSAIIPEDETIVSDGHTLWTYFKDRKRCDKTPIDAGGVGIMDECNLVGIFFHPHYLLSRSALFDMNTRYVGQETVDGQVCDVLQMEVDQPGPSNPRTTLFIGADRFIHKISDEVGYPGDRATQEATFTHIRADMLLPNALFQFQPPKQARIVSIPAPNYDATLITVGLLAPPFTRPTPDGGLLSLTDALKDKKALLLSFFFYGCTPCREELPQVQALYDKFKTGGLEVLAVDVGDSPTLVTRYWKATKFTFPVVITPQTEPQPMLTFEYGIKAYPTLYLLNAEGRVIWRSHTFDEKAITKVLATLGLNKPFPPRHRPFCSRSASRKYLNLVNTT